MTDLLKRGYQIRRTIPLFVLCLLIFMPLAYSQEDSGIVAEPYLHEGDMRLFDGEMQDARDIYEFALKENPDSYEALWRLSRLYVSCGMAAEKIRDKKKEWEKAEEYARRAVERNPDRAEGHLYAAIAKGKLALYSSAAEKVKVAWEIKKEAEKAMELDPAQQKVYLVLGSWNRNVATASSLERQLAKIFFEELPQGSLEESLEFLLKSIELGGTNVRNYYELALTYEAMDNYEAAERQYNNALAADSFYPEDPGIKEKIRETLRKFGRGHGAKKN